MYPNNYGYYQQPYPTYAPPNYIPAAPQQQMTQPDPSNQKSEQLVNGGFIVVQSEEDVRRYAVAPGNYVTFRLENQPVLIEKSLSRSQFASPHYERYKLTKESSEDISEEGQEPTTDKYASADELSEVKQAIEQLNTRIDKLKDLLAKKQPRNERRQRHNSNQPNNEVNDI